MPHGLGTQHYEKAIIDFYSVRSIKKYQAIGEFVDGRRLNVVVKHAHDDPVLKFNYRGVALYDYLK